MPLDYRNLDGTKPVEINCCSGVPAIVELRNVPREVANKLGNSSACAVSPEEFKPFLSVTLERPNLGRDAVDAIIAKVSTNIIEYTKNENDLADARIELGNALEAALKNK